MSDFSDWYNTIPQVTRYWFTSAIVIPLLGRIGIIPARLMYLDWNLFWNNFEIWRPVTAFLFYPLTPQTGFHWLMTIYFLYTYSKNIETSLFSGRPADYVFMLVFSWIVSVGLGFALGMYFLLDPMVLSVLYNWCQFNKDATVSFWFGTRFKAMYLPWILVAFNMVLSGGGLNELVGILIGHTYYFLAVQYPTERGTAPLIKTPQFFYNWFPSTQGGVSGFGPSPSRPAPAQREQVQQQRRGGNFWGQGQAVGGN